MGPPALRVIKPQLARVEPGAGVRETLPSAWLRLRCVCSGSDIGPQPLPTHVTRHQVSWHVSPHACLTITRVREAHNSSDTDQWETGGGCRIHLSSPASSLACWLFSMSRSASSRSAPVSCFLSLSVLSNIYALKKIASSFHFCVEWQ